MFKIELGNFIKCEKATRNGLGVIKKFPQEEGIPPPPV